MKYLSVCSGIEAASVAWHPLGWDAVGFSEIEKFPSAVLAHHYPDVSNFGDMTKFKEWPHADVDVLVGGTPCQSFSVAGLRKGLDDPRGNLMLTYLAIADKYRPTWLVWENVPGVLSSNGGRDFACFLRGLAQLGYGFAYRILDAQYFGVAQRRRRVFVVGCIGNWRRAAAVLFERNSLQGNPAPRREKGQRPAPCLDVRAGRSGETTFHTSGGLVEIAAPLPGHHPRADLDNDTYIPVPHADISPAIKARDSKGASSDGDGDGAILVPMVSHSLRGEGFDASEDGSGRGTPLVPVEPFTLAIRGRGDSHQLEYRQDGTANALLTPNGGRAGIGVGAIALYCKASGRNGFAIGEIAGTQRGMGHANSHQNGGGHQAVVYDTTNITSPQNGANPRPGDPCFTLAKGQHPPLLAGMQVRRLTPKECCRLQGFPDDYLDIIYNGKPAADGPKYKALGNSMAVPCMAWIGRRIADVSALGACT